MLDEHNVLSNRIKKIMSIKKDRMLTNEEHSELISLLNIARSDTDLGSNNYPFSSNSFCSVSPSNHSTGTNDGFPPYNPADFE